MENVWKHFFKSIIQYNATIWCKFNLHQSYQANNGQQFANKHFKINWVNFNKI